MSFWTQWRIPRTHWTNHVWNTIKVSLFILSHPRRDSSSPKSSFRMTKKGNCSWTMTKNSPACHSERSEESRVLNGLIMFKTLFPNRITHQSTLIVGILPRPKARSEWQKRRIARSEWQRKRSGPCRITKTTRLVILNAVKNPSFLQNES